MAETTQQARTDDSPPAEPDARQQMLAAITLPPLDGLTEAQVRGTTCVWDGIALTPESAVDLGPRKKRRLDGEYDWFPRGCKRCTADRAWAWFFDHAHKCPQCKTDPNCPIAVAVRRIMREGRL
ncbi:hypothetical protein ACF1G4_03150 [Streptomyces caelestis]